MLYNVLRRVATVGVARVYRHSQMVDKSPILTKLGTSHTGVGARLFSAERPEDIAKADEILELLGQMTAAADDLSQVNTLVGEPDVDSDELVENASDLPGHRIRGILVPTEETLTARVAGQTYQKLPIAHVHASRNNTIIIISDHTGSKFISHASGGSVGFKNAKKRTEVAARAAALTAGQKARKQGVTHVRVALKGLGQGRLASCRGFQEAGLEVVSISDVSVVNWGTHFPKKRRR